MQNLADAVLQYLWFLNFCEEEELSLDASVKQIESVIYEVKSSFTDEERRALQDAARRSLASWLREPDRHGYTPRSLLTSQQREFLEQIAEGHFSGAPLDDDEA
ncbi:MULTISPECIES: hypothetical protein [Xanthomonas]|uniref:Uncharacterized protein n=1 Tax=Xanthomonas arboricola TaxID=56448 RepID=A0AB73GZA9_9XANT|nr:MULTISPECIES: hypothetical protein [Xanthomonas]MBB5671465.1 hypothetical protein [Xanthomonas arboricola]QWM98215.1 hypothetical protein DGN21_01810 [Xanthomonas sp. MLO165]